MKTTGKDTRAKWRPPFIRSTDSHAITPRHQYRTVSGKFLPLRGIHCLHDGGARRLGDGRCGRDGQAADKGRGSDRQRRSGRRRHEHGTRGAHGQTPCLVIRGGPVSVEKEADVTHPHGLTYRQYRYRLAEIAAHVSVHAATVSRRLKQVKDANV